MPVAKFQLAIDCTPTSKIGNTMARWKLESAGEAIQRRVAAKANDSSRSTSERRSDCDDGVIDIEDHIETWPMTSGVASKVSTWAI